MSMRAAVRLQTLGFDQVYRYADGKTDWAASGLPIEGEHAAVPRLLDITDREVPTCRLWDRLGEVRERVSSTGGRLCVVTDEHRVILGQLTEQMLRSDAGSGIEDVMESGPATYRPNVSLEELAQRLEGHPRVQHVLVSTPDGELLGALWRKDLEEVVKGEHDHTHAD
jgi:CBS domain-containing protein